MKIKIIYLIIISVLFTNYIFAKEIKKVKITSALANIRSKSGLTGKIIKTAQKGDLFILLGKAGTWYKVALAIDKKGDPEFGYIHSSIATLVTEQTEDNSKIQPTAYKKKERVSIKSIKPKQTISQEKLFSGSYLKGGIMTAPEVDNFSDKWIVSWGFDKPIGKYITWGLELQPYYRSIDSSYGDQISVKTIASNLFLNLKGGINFGQFIKSLKFLTIYAGGGLGSNISFTSVKLNEIQDSQFNTNFAWHIMFGTEIKLGSMELIVELQSNNIILKDVEPATQTYKFIFFGLRF